MLFQAYENLTKAPAYVRLQGVGQQKGHLIRSGKLDVHSYTHTSREAISRI